ncbi:hypothetical protein MMC17_009248 [Xylographa soralifera]|nr:hypothetical protein [Xylographa soralifera]
MSIVKLKSCWDRIQDAPEDVQNLITRIELLLLILNDIEDDQTQNPVSSLLFDGSTVSQCLKHCKSAADRLRDLTGEMAKEIDSSNQFQRKWASAKVLLKKDKTAKFEKRLQSCITLLQLSLDTYKMALLRLQPDIISAKVSQNVLSLLHSTSTSYGHSPQKKSVPITSCSTIIFRRYISNNPCYSFWHSISPLHALGSFIYEIRYHSKSQLNKANTYDKSTSHYEIVASYRWPAWLMNRTWYLRVLKAHCGWDFKFRQYNIVPDSSLVIQYAEVGNVAGLQQLFDHLLASPWDCDQFGNTLIHLAALHGRYSACKLLIDLGADVNQRARVTKHTPITYALVDAGLYGASESAEETLNTSRLLLSKAEIDVDFPWDCQGLKEGFTLQQRYCNPRYYETALEKRPDGATAFKASYYLDGPALFRIALAHNHIPQLAVTIRDRGGERFLHTGAEAVGEASGSGLNRLEGWRRILREQVGIGADIYALTSESCNTPHIRFYTGFINQTGKDDQDSLLSVLQMWVRDLRSSGVDLYEYGKREKRLYQTGLARKEFNNSIYPPTRWRLESFTYGSLPNDWHLHVECLGKVVEEVSRIEPFSDTEHVSDPSAAIPGSWVDTVFLSVHQVSFTYQDACLRNRCFWLHRTQACAEPHRGALDDLESLQSGARAADGVIHLAFIHDFTDYASATSVDRAAIEAMGEAMAGTGKPLIIASGTLIVPPGKLATEDTEPERNKPPFSDRALSADSVFTLSKEKQVRSIVVRLPPTVHGTEDKGMIPHVIDLARQNGFVTYIGDGSQRWPAVHRLDAAVLFRLALEKGIAGATYNAVAEQGVPMTDITAVIGKHLRLPVEGKAMNEVVGAMGFLAYLVGSDNPTSSGKTQKELGWHFTQSGLLADMEANYFSQV